MKGLVNALNNRLTSDQICNGLSFRVTYCEGSGVQICVGCKRICVRDWCTAAIDNVGAALTVQSCQRTCVRRKAYYQIVDLKYSLQILYPQIGPLSLQSNETTRSSLTLNVNVTTGTGYLYCLATPTTIAPNISSPYTVKQYGTSTILLDPGLKTITLSSLSPNTEYNVYCYSEDFSLHSMSLSTVIGTKIVAMTACCPQITFVNAPNPIPALSGSAGDISVLPTFTVSTDDISTRGKIISLALVANTSSFTSELCRNITTLSGIVNPVAVVSPSNFNISQQLAISPILRTFVIKGDPGCYTLIASLRVAGGNDRTSSFSTVNRSVVILSPSQAIAAPTIQSALFSNDGRQLLVSFSIATDAATSLIPQLTKVFQCSRVLVFIGAAFSSCTFSSGSLITVTLPTNTTISVNDAVSVVPNTVQSLYCSSVLVPAGSVSSCSYSSSKDSVLVSSPTNSVLPSVSLVAPQIVVDCDDLIIDPTSSTGDGGRLWRKVTWSATLRFTNGSTVVPINRNIGAYLQSTYGSSQTTKPVTLPSRFLLLSTGSLTLSLTLENFLNQTNRASISIQITSGAGIPLVSIPGPNLLIVYRSQALTLPARITFPSCYGDINTTKALSYTWTTFRDLTYQGSLQSQSSNPSIFYLPAYSLTALTQYTIQLVITSTLTQNVQTAYVKVQVLANSAFAIISGGSLRTQSASQPLVIDGSSSYSYDTPTNASKTFMYTWSCTEITFKYYGQSCSGFILPSVSTFSESLLPYANFNITRSLLITLMITSQSDSSISASTTQTVNVISSVNNAPIVALASPLRKYNPYRQQLFLGKVVLDRLALVKWTVTNDLGQNTTILAVPSFIVSSGARTLQQAIPANSLTPGGVYLLTLSAVYSDNTGAAYAQISITMNAPPYGGFLTVTPAIGYAINTSFAFQASGWIDSADDYPLQYTMLYSISSSLAANIVQGSSSLTFASSLLGPGLPSLNYQVICSVQVSDTLGSFGSAAYNVKVQPLQSSSGSSTANLQVLNTLNSLLKPAKEQADSNTIAQVVSTIVTSLNSANCSFADVSYCAAKKREPCAYTSNTCGKCKSGYVGPRGDSNVPCKIVTSATTKRFNETCSGDDDCLSDSCDLHHNRCLDPPKSCPNQCSGQGICTYYNYNGTLTSNCRISNVFCTAKCECNPGFYTEDCSFGDDSYSFALTLRETMCESLDFIAKFEDNNENNLIRRSTAVSNIFLDPAQISYKALENCTNALLNGIENAPLIAGSEAVAPYAVSALTQIGRVPDISIALQDRAMAALAVLSAGQQSYRALGEPLQVIAASYNGGGSSAESLRYATQLVDSNNTNSNTGGVYVNNVPQNDFEVANNVAPNVIRLAVPDGITKNGQGISQAVTLFTSSFRRGTTSSPGVAFRTSTYNLDGTSSLASFSSAESDSSRRALVITDDATYSSYTIDITFQNFDVTNYYTSVPQNETVDCLRVGFNYTVIVNCSSDINYYFNCPGTYGVRHNYTCPVYRLLPFCSVWDGAAYSHDNSGCDVLHFGPTNTTCRCDGSKFGGLGDSRRRLSGFTKSGGFVEVAATSKVVATQFGDLITYVGDPAPVYVPPSPVALAGTLILSALLLLGALYLGYDDYKRQRIISGLQKYLMQKTSATGDILLLRNPYFPLFGSGASGAQNSAGVSGDHGLHAITALAGYAQHGEVVRPKTPHQAHHTQHVGLAIKTIVNACLPLEYSGFSWQRRYRDKFYEFHDLWVVFSSALDTLPFLTGVGKRFRRAEREFSRIRPESSLYSIQWAIFGFRVLNIIFWSTLFVWRFFPADGKCESLSLEGDCLYSFTIYGLHDQCVWKPTLYSACSFNQRSIDDPLSLALIVATVLVLTSPFEPMLRLVLTAYQLALRLEKNPTFVAMMTDPPALTTAAVTSNQAKQQAQQASVALGSKVAFPSNNGPKRSKVIPVAPAGSVSRGIVVPVSNVRHAPGGSSAISTLQPWQVQSQQHQLDTQPVVKLLPPRIFLPFSLWNSRHKKGKKRGHGHGHNNLIEHDGHVQHNPFELRLTKSYELRSVYRTAHSLFCRRVLFVQAARFTLLQQLSDKLSARKEATSIVDRYSRDGKSFSRLKQTTVDNSSLLRAIGTRLRDQSYQYYLRMKNSRSPAAVQPAEASSHNVSTNNGLPSLLTYRVHQAVRDTRQQARQTRHHLLYLDRDTDRDMYLLQQFMCDMLPTFGRKCAEAHFKRFFYILDLNLTTHFLNFLLVMLIVMAIGMAAISAFLASRIGGQAGYYLLLILFMCFVFEYGILQPAQIWVEHLWISSFIAERMRAVHALLRERARHIVSRRSGQVKSAVASDTTTVFTQHFCVSTRLARLFPECPASRLLMSLTDHDLREVDVYQVKSMSLLTRAWRAVNRRFMLLSLGLPVLWNPYPLFHELSLTIWITFLVCAGGVGLVIISENLTPYPVEAVAFILFVLALVVPARAILHRIHEELQWVPQHEANKKAKAEALAAAQAAALAASFDDEDETSSKRRSFSLAVVVPIVNSGNNNAKVGPSSPIKHSEDELNQVADNNIRKKGGGKSKEKDLMIEKTSDKSKKVKPLAVGQQYNFAEEYLEYCRNEQMTLPWARSNKRQPKQIISFEEYQQQKEEVYISLIERFRTGGGSKKKSSRKEYPSRVSFAAVAPMPEESKQQDISTAIDDNEVAAAVPPQQRRSAFAGFVEDKPETSVLIHKPTEQEEEKNGFDDSLVLVDHSDGEPQVDDNRIIVPAAHKPWITRHVLRLKKHEANLAIRAKEQEHFNRHDDDSFAWIDDEPIVPKPKIEDHPQYQQLEQKKQKILEHLAEEEELHRKYSRPPLPKDIPPESLVRVSAEEARSRPRYIPGPIRRLAKQKQALAELEAEQAWLKHDDGSDFFDPYDDENPIMSSSLQSSSSVTKKEKEGGKVMHEMLQQMKSDPEFHQQRPQRALEHDLFDNTTTTGSITHHRTLQDRQNLMVNNFIQQQQQLQEQQQAATEESKNVAAFIPASHPARPHTAAATIASSIIGKKVQAPPSLTSRLMSLTTATATLRSLQRAQRHAEQMAQHHMEQHQPVDDDFDLHAMLREDEEQKEAPRSRTEAAAAVRRAGLTAVVNAEEKKEEDPPMLMQTRRHHERTQRHREHQLREQEETFIPEDDDDDGRGFFDD